MPVWSFFARPAPPCLHSDPMTQECCAFLFVFFCSCSSAHCSRIALHSRSKIIRFHPSSSPHSPTPSSLFPYTHERIKWTPNTFTQILIVFSFFISFKRLLLLVLLLIAVAVAHVSIYFSLETKEAQSPELYSLQNANAIQPSHEIVKKKDFYLLF